MTAAFNRRLAIWLVAPLCLLAASCLLLPGKFTSSLDIQRDQTFRFAYSGEIHMMALSQLARMGRGDGAKFQPAPCFGENGNAARECSKTDIDRQRRDWDSAQADAVQRRKNEAESMKGWLGGIDPSDPRAAEEFAARIRRQHGWRKVVHKGDGLFEVDFALAGRLDHDFAFPSIERFPTANPFVQIALRSDGTVRVDAPGFGPMAGGDGFTGMMGAGLMGAASSQAGAQPPGFPQMDGTFTLRTDGAVLANNTDEGPQDDPAGHRLTWRVRTPAGAAPMALIRLGR